MLRLRAFFFVCAIRAFRLPFDVAIRDICPFQSNMFINMKKRQRDEVRITKIEQHVLQLAKSGNFADLHALVAYVEISDNVMCKVFRRLNVHISNMCKEFEREQDEFITEMK